jgi:hypothetical protein
VEEISSDLRKKKNSFLAFSTFFGQIENAIHSNVCIQWGGVDFYEYFKER